MNHEALPSAASVDRLIRAMSVFARTVNHVVETQAVETALDAPLSSSKVQILRLLGRRGAHNTTQIARFLGVSTPAASQLMESMVRNDLVVRSTAAHDRREAELCLTAKGREWLLVIRRRQRHYVRNAVRQAPEGSFDRWIEALEEMARGLAWADRAFERFCLQCGAHVDGTCVLVGGRAECLFLRKQSETAHRKKTNGSRRASKKSSRKS